MFGLKDVFFVGMRIILFRSDFCMDSVADWTGMIQIPPVYRMQNVEMARF